MNNFKGHIFSRNQLFFYKFKGVHLHVKVSFATHRIGDASDGRGLLSAQTELYFFESEDFKVYGQKETKWQFSRGDFNIHDLQKEMKSLGVGGLHEQINQIFSELVYPRCMPQELARQTKRMYKQGLVLHGPPGTGKTLVARALSKFLKAKLKVVRGPELFSNFIGESEEKTRAIFEEAIKELQEKGDQSPLHVVVFDELDSIAKKRGENPHDTTGDRVVNQLLTMIDGYSGLTNVLLIGTTNKLNLIDEALLRSGRLELHVRVDLPDYHGRLEILKIIAKRWRWAGILDPEVNLQTLARETVGFSGADLQGVMQTAYNNAATRCIEEQGFIAAAKWETLKITVEDISKAAIRLLLEKEGKSSKARKRYKLRRLFIKPVVDFKKRMRRAEWLQARIHQYKKIGLDK